MIKNQNATHAWDTIRQSWCKFSGEIQPGNIWIDAYVGTNLAKERLVLCDTKKCLITGLVIVVPVTIESLGTLILPLPGETSTPQPEMNKADAR